MVNSTWFRSTRQVEIQYPLVNILNSLSLSENVFSHQMNTQSMTPLVAEGNIRIVTISVQASLQVPQSQPQKHHGHLIHHKRGEYQGLIGVVLSNLFLNASNKVSGARTRGVQALQTKSTHTHYVRVFLSCSVRASFQLPPTSCWQSHTAHMTVSALFMSEICNFKSVTVSVTSTLSFCFARMSLNYVAV